MRQLSAALLLLAMAGPAAAQAPRITPAGDPSVRDDSIYALAVLPQDHPDEPFVYLLDDGVVRLEADGRVARTYRQVIQILTREGVEAWAEMSFGYAPERERLTINWVRVRGLDGRVISDRPAHEQESRAPVAESAPVYTDRMVRRLSLGGVEAGTIVDYSVTTEVLTPLVPNDFSAWWRVTTGRLTRRSRYVIDAPASVQLNLKETNFRWPRPVSTQNGRRMWTWAAAEIPKLESEPFATSPNSVEVSVGAALPRRWTDIASYYHGLSQDRYGVDSTLATRVAEQLRGARTLDDSLRAAHRWVAQDFRYVSLSLGLGGYQPRTPASVLETRYGDCKDKATLFIALARRMGVRAWPVLLSMEATADSTMPTVSQFDHVIAAVERPGVPGYLYLDLTSDLTPYGQLPPSEQGGFALVVKENGRAEQVVLPREPVEANLLELRIVGELTTEGLFNGRFIRRGLGSQQYAMRQALAELPTGKARSDLLRTVASSVFEDATGDSLELFDGRDLTAEPRVSFVVRSGRAMRSNSGIDMLRIPLDNMAVPSLANDLAARGARRYPIEKAEVTPPWVYDGEFVLTLPEGWRVRLPANVSVTSAFGSYSAEYGQTGRRVRVSRRLSGSRGIMAPDANDELINWIRSVSRDDVRFLVVERSNP